MNIFDSHQHFWTLTNSFTNWPPSELEAIYRDFGPENLAPHLAAAQVTGTILVQAAPATAETQFLLDLANRVQFVRGVVGWIDFEADSALAELEEIASDPLLKGLRPMVQGIEDPEWLLQTKFTPIFEALIERKLCFDALIRRDQIDQVIRLAKRHPNLRIVIDHAAKPNIAAEEITKWALDLSTAAKAPSVFCKLSGLWAEAGGDPSTSRIAPYAGHIIDCFGPDRVMWGSDWPVLELAGTYAAWLEQAQALTADLSLKDRQAIFAGTARQFYNVD